MVTHRFLRLQTGKGVQQGRHAGAADDVVLVDQSADVGEWHPLDALGLPPLGRRADVRGTVNMKVDS